MGRVALDVCLMWYQIDEFILEKWQDGVLDAVERDVPRSIHYLLHGLLQGTHGYDPKYIAEKLMNIGPEYVSKTGWHIFRLLCEGAGADHVRRGITFWDSILKHSPKPKPEALVGFGWWASVPGIDQGQWEALMLRTCELAKKMEWPHEVAKRISTSETVTDAGWQILARLINDIGLGHDKPLVAEYAIEALRKTVNIADAPESRSHLCNVLINHGFHGAREF